MNNIKNVPEIRFKGYYDKDGNWIAFTHPWEQRKLGDVAQEFKSGNSLKADEIDITGDYPVYGGNGLRGYTSNYNHDGEYALIGRQGALCGNMNYSVGKAYFTEHAVVVKAGENNDTKFLYYMLDTMNLGQYSDQSAQPGLAVNKLVKLENRFPTKEEQQRIGWYFSNIDNLITLHQRKVKIYEKLKKGLMQKLFSQEVRFKADDGSDFSEWEERDIGELVTEYTEKTTQNNQFEVLSSTHDGIKFQKDHFNKKTASADTTGYKIVPKGYFTYRAMSDNDVFVFNRQMIIDKGIVSPAYPVFDVIGIDKMFFEQYINNTDEIRKQLIMLKEGGTRYALSFSKFCAMHVVIPSSFEEQQKIAKCLSSLDNVIENQKATVAVLKKLKKCMLQKMFV